MANNDSVNNALATLRDAADNEIGKDEPDMRPVAEAWQKFHEEWVSLRVETLRKEENPDEAQESEEDNSEDASRTVEIDEKVEEPVVTEPVDEAPKPSSRKANKSNE